MVSIEVMATRVIKLSLLRIVFLAALAVIAPAIVRAQTAPTVQNIPDPSRYCIFIGESATIKAEASGTLPLSYQWLADGVAIPGATSATFATPPLDAPPGTLSRYALRVSNAYGTVTREFPLTVFPSPAISGGGIFVRQSSGDRWTLTPGISFPPGAPGPFVEVKWYRNDVLRSPATTTFGTPGSYPIYNPSPTHTGSYRVEVTDSFGHTRSSAPVTFTVVDPPVVTRGPTSQLVAPGAPAFFEVVATGSDQAAMSYQWRKDGQILAGQSNARLEIAASASTDAGTYTVTVGYADILNSATFFTTPVAADLFVLTPPRVTTVLPPQLAVPVGGTLDLRIAADGTPGLPLVYRWSHNGAVIPTAAGPAFNTSNASEADGGVYTVDVGYLDPTTNELVFSTSTSTTVALQSSALVNLAVRSRTNPSGTPLTIGFVVGGARSKSLLLRGIGPTLANYGVTQPLLRPSLTLHAGGTFRQSVLRWGGSSVLLDAFARAGAFSLPLDSADSAFTADVTPGTYTVQLLPVDGSSTGIALVEAYALDTSPGAAPLLNLSVLSTTGPSEDILTAGFVVRSAAPRRLLIRVIGPSLAQFAVSDPLPYPRLVITNDRGEFIADNRGWFDLPSLAEAFAAAGAFPLGLGSADAAAVVELPAGAYTVQASGVPGTAQSGSALIELYDLAAVAAQP